jgi:hypothetical protein
MPIFIKSAVSSVTFKLDVRPGDKISAIKMMIYDREGMNPGQQRLIFGGHDLEDDRTIQDYGVQRESIIHLIYKRRSNANLNVRSYISPDSFSFP